MSANGQHRVLADSAKIGDSKYKFCVWPKYVGFIDRKCFEIGFGESGLNVKRTLVHHCIEDPAVAYLRTHLSVDLQFFGKEVSVYNCFIRFFFLSTFYRFVALVWNHEYRPRYRLATRPF